MKIQVCTWKSCKSRFSEYIIKRIEWDKVRFNLENVNVETCPCQWNCKEWPTVIIDGKKESYCDPLKVSKIMFDKIKQTQQSRKPKQDKKEKRDKKDESQNEE